MIANKDAAIAIVNKLTGSQMRLWLYLMMVDSFADTTTDGEKIYHKIPSPAEIAIKIGASPSTVEKDMRKLKKLGLYEYRITGWQGHNSSAAKAKQESQRLKHKKKPQRQAQQSLGLNLTGSLNNPPSEKNEPQSQSQYSFGLNKPDEVLNKPDGSLNKPDESLNKPSEETESTEKLGVSESLQIYTDLLQTFSEAGERERFVNFCKRQAEKMPREVVMIRSWIGKHAQELLEMYKESTGQIETQEKEKPSAGVDSDEELINAALESGEIEDYDMGCKMVRYPGTKWWTDVEDFLKTKREQPSDQLPVTSNQLPATPEETTEEQAQEEFYLPELKLKTINRSAQRIIDEALRNGEIEAHNQASGMVKIKGNCWWTYTDEFVAAKRKKQSPVTSYQLPNQLPVTSEQSPSQLSVTSHQSSATPEETEGETNGEG